ncbi:MAG: hypothetical protein CMH65_08030 [Nevskiales bacterium]|nr:hypothetical protein [Nevskiales bacterium]
MTAIAFSTAAVDSAKRALRDFMPDSKSAHITEALAAGLGFRTHAALISAIKAAPDETRFIELDERAFEARITSLEEGTAAVWSDDDQGWSEWPNFPDRRLVIRTRSDSFYDRGYGSYGWKAWRNVMVATINAALEQKLITLLPDDNRWLGYVHHPKDGRNEGVVFDFYVKGIAAVGYVNDAGFGELSIHGALWPTPDAKRWICAAGLSSPGFHAGKVVAQGWLERKDGAWLQRPSEPRPSLSCRAPHLRHVAGLDIPTMGFGDRGDFKM